MQPRPLPPPWLRLELDRAGEALVGSLRQDCEERGVCARGGAWRISLGENAEFRGEIGVADRIGDRGAGCRRRGGEKSAGFKELGRRELARRGVVACQRETGKARGGSRCRLRGCPCSLGVAR